MREVLLSIRLFLAVFRIWSRKIMDPARKSDLVSSSNSICFKLANNDTELSQNTSAQDWSNQNNDEF